jgi:hypothetical protein
MGITVEELISWLETCAPKAKVSCSIDIGDEQDTTKRIYGYVCRGINSSAEDPVMILFDEVSPNCEATLYPDRGDGRPVCVSTQPSVMVPYSLSFGDEFFEDTLRRPGLD